MARDLFHIDPDEIQNGNIDRIADGEYFVTGIGKFITTDESTGLPCFVPDSYTGGLVVKMELLCGNGQPGPAVSATPAEFWMLVEALNGDVKVSPTLRTSGDAMVRAADSTKQNAKGISVKSENGWVNRLYKLLRLPRARYTVQFKTAVRPDRAKENPLHFQEMENKWNKEKKQYQLVFEFEIVGDHRGKPTLYDGHTIVQYMNNAFAPEFMDMRGVVHTAIEDKRFHWLHTPNGGITPYAPAWSTFVKYFCAGIENHEWQTEADKSEYGVIEVHEPQYVIVDYALRAKEKVVVYWQQRPKGDSYHFKWDDIPVDNQAEAIDVEDEQEQPAKLNDLLDYISKKWSDKVVFDQSEMGDNSVVFTEVGRAWAKEYMSAPWQKAGMSLENRKPLHELNETEVSRLYDAFVQIYGQIEQESGW